MAMLTPLKLGVAATLIGASALAQAALTVYTTRASFVAAVSATTGTDTFNDLLPATSYAGPLSRSAGALGYEVDANDGILYGAGSNFNPWLSNNQAAGTIDFYSFDAGVNAAGGRFFGSDISGMFQSGATIYVTATDADGSVTQTVLDARRRSFVGFVSDGSLLGLSVSADQTDGPVWGTVNNLILAAVPEPATHAMFLAGLGVIGVVARRRMR